jgi:hypothetical protein
MGKTDINNAGSKGGRLKNKLKVQRYAPKIEPKYKKESPFSKYFSIFVGCTISGHGGFSINK